MGAGKKLRNTLTKMAEPLDFAIAKLMDREDMPSVAKLIRKGHDPVYAVYAFRQHITSHFAEGVSHLPEMKKYAKITDEAEEEYMPSSPPMSPLTGSFFTTWAFYDLQFDGTDTLASCLIEANDLIGMEPDHLDALNKMIASRMGIYEHVGMDGPYVRLRELVTEAEFTCLIVSGYRGRSGELWYVRLLPPLLPNLSRYYVAFTTPYILMASKDDWLQFLKRSLSQSNFGADKGGLHRFLKYGPNPNYWNEFVYAGYHHHQSDAIFLTGIPDLKATLPHA